MKKTSRTTIKELAKMSGYSTSTISRVLANSASVREETKRGVERLLAAHNYRPGSFSTRCSRTIQKIVMVVVNDPSNEFYIKTIRTIQAACTAAGFIPLIGTTGNDPELEEKYVMAAQDSALAGIILMTPVETDNLKRLIEGSATPIVLVNRYLRSVDLDVVSIDNYRGGYLATEHLIRHGGRKICHVAGPQYSSASRDRLRGYQDALADAGLEASPDDIHQGNLLRSSGREFAKLFLARKMPWDSIFFANDMMAAGFIDVAGAGDIRIPEDASIICFDDSPAVSEGPIPITTVSFDGGILGEHAAKLLLSRISGSDDPPTKLIYSPVLKERRSVRRAVSPVRQSDADRGESGAMVFQPA